MNRSIAIFLASLSVLFAAGLVAADVNGASVSAGTPERGSADSAGNASAYAGNITELTITGNSLTQAWQGYYGNVSGVIELTDGSDNVLYNWSLASPQGEVYASNSSSVTWANIECFNYTNNLTQLEGSYNIDPTDADGVNETFFEGNAHDAFSTGSTSFTEGECPSARIFDSTQSSQDNSFEEVLLTDRVNTVFAALLEQSLAGFDNNLHDFEMLVLEDGHSGDTTVTTYFFYIELE